MRIAILATAAICIGGTAAAQLSTGGAAHGSGRGPVTFRGNPAQGVVERLGAQLELNAGQKAQLQAVLDAQRAKLDEFVKEQKASGQEVAIEQLLTMQKQLERESMDELRSILTQAQFSRLEQLVQAQGGLLLGPSPGMSVSTDGPMLYATARENAWLTRGACPPWPGHIIGACRGGLLNSAATSRTGGSSDYRKSTG